MKWILKDVSWLSVVVAIVIILMTPSVGVIMSVFTEMVLKQKDADMPNPADQYV